MATYEKNVLLTSKDESGNLNLLFPVTRLACVDGAEELVSFGEAQALTDDQMAQARANIGAVAANHKHLYGEAVKTEGDGAAYTATVEGITELVAGIHFMMIPHTVSTNVLPSLNVNGLGAKKIRRRVSNSTVTTVAATVAGWLGANKPILMTYDGTFWIADFTRPNANDIYGSVAIANGGTGATTAEAARENLGAARKATVVGETLIL